MSIHEHNLQHFMQQDNETSEIPIIVQIIKEEANTEGRK